jgi:tetratricopeptide (TPR) repeat protein
MEDTLPALRALLDGHGDDPQWNVLDPTQRRQQMLDAVQRVFLGVAQVQPVLVIVEDLHWIDTETQAVLQTLVESLPTARLLLLVNYRPEYQHTWGSKTYYRQLRLDPLRRENLNELLLALLGADATVEPLKPVLISRTGGNPLFLEESVRTLIETNVLIGARGAHRLARMVDTIDMPRTVQAIIASRIDRLAPSDKQLLQTASVIGKDVPLALLLAITKLPEADVLAGLVRLQATEFLYQTSSSLEPGYTFKHALTQEVAYGSLLHDHRRTLHAQIVDAIESLHGNRLGLEIERLALHAYRGHLREKAVDYLRQAGRKAAARCALRDAQAWFEQGLEVLEALPESPSNLEQAFEIRLGLRPVLNQLGEFSQALQLLRELETLAKRLNDERLQGRVCAFLTNVYSLLGRPDEGSAFGARALEIAKNLGDLELHIIARAFLAEAQYLRGEYNGVVELACANIAALPTNWAHNYLGMGAPASIYDRCWLSASLAQLGRFTEATEYQREAIQLAGSTNHAFTIGIAHYPAGTLHPLKGDWKKARAVIEDWIAVLRAGTVIGLLADAMAVSCWVLAQLGEMSEALRRLSEAEQLVERRATKGIGASGGWVYRSLGHARLLLGQLDKAQSWGERAVGSSTHQPGFAAHGLHLLGEIAAHPDRFDAESGAGHYRQALALAEPRGMRPLVAHCHLGLGKLSRRTNKREQAQEHLTTATTMYREMGMTYWLEKAEEESQALT